MLKKTILLKSTAQVISAYVEKNHVSANELPNLINKVSSSLKGLVRQEAAASASSQAPIPAVNPKKSVTKDYIICLEDGKKFKSLKRHLSSHYNLTPEAYRKKWGLPRDYPMVASEYSDRRSQLARDSGLGKRKPEENGANSLIKEVYAKYG